MQVHPSRVSLTAQQKLAEQALQLPSILMDSFIPIRKATLSGGT